MNPGDWPVLRPNKPFRLGPVLCLPPYKTKSKREGGGGGDLQPLSCDTGHISA